MLGKSPLRAGLRKRQKQSRHTQAQTTEEQQEEKEQEQNEQEQEQKENHTWFQALLNNKPQKAAPRTQIN